MNKPEFDLYENPKPDKKMSQTYHARIVNAQKSDVNDLSETISKRCTVTKTDIVAVLTSLSDAMIDEFKQGNRVHLNGLGYFYPVIECGSNSNDRNKITEDDISFKTIRFRPETILKDKVGAFMFIKKANSKAKHSIVISEEEMEKRISAYLKQRNFITRGEIEILCNIKKGKALKLIRKLVDEGKLVNSNTDRFPIYECPK